MWSELLQKGKEAGFSTGHSLCRWGSQLRTTKVAKKRLGAKLT